MPRPRAWVEHGAVVERLLSGDLSPTPGYSHAVVAGPGTLVLTAGACPLDPDGRIVGVGDYAAQARQVLANLAEQLATADAALADVVRITVYVVSTDRDDLLTVWQEVTDSDLVAPAATLLGVSLLGYPDQLVEIEADAVING